MTADIEWLEDDRCAVALDTRHDPVLITTWHGNATVALVDRYYSWSDANAAATLAAEQRIVHVVDLSYCGKPAARVRKRVYEHTRGNLSAEVVMSTVVVLDNPRMRGVITATRWMSGARDGELVIVETIGEALSFALDRLRAANIPQPPSLEPDRYRAPMARPRS